MRNKYLLLFIVTVFLFSCKKKYETYNPPSQPPVVPAPGVFLKDLTLSHLPSPYYHFEYDTSGKVSFVSFASGFTMYDVKYNGNRISEMRNNIIINKDRLQYFYDNEGRVNIVTYADSTGLVYEGLNLSYEGPKLIKLQRRLKSGAGFVIDKIMTMSYYPDGNLDVLIDHRFPGNGAAEEIFIDKYEQYDNKINVDGFGRINNDFFHHLVLLPGVQLQKNNPGRITRTGNGSFTEDYTYTYNEKGAPLTRSGDFVYTSGTNAGQHLHLSAFYTYY
jgi:hypothetical protein